MGVRNVMKSQLENMDNSEENEFDVESRDDVSNKNESAKIKLASYKDVLMGKNNND